MKTFNQIWDEHPFTSCLKNYQTEEILVYNSDTSYVTRTVYPQIKCLILKIYRGVCCWISFNKWLKVSFPNLEMLFISQSYTYCENEENFLNFMNDPWLKKVFIYTIQDSYTFKNTLTRVFHNCRCKNPIWNCESRWLAHNISKVVKSCDIDPSSDFCLECHC
jgi:hypothetical protein